MSNRESITPGTMHLNEVEPKGFCDSPRSLFLEVTQLREAVVRLCELQKELAAKVEAALTKKPITSEGGQIQ
jgi:hypothetical protein